MAEISGKSRESKKRVLLVDDHPLMRNGLRVMIDETGDLEVCQEGGNAAEAVGLVEKSKPDVIVLDLGLPDRNGLEALKDILAIRPDLPALIVSMYDELVYAERTLRAGAKGYLMKECGPEKILDAIRLVLKGGICVSDQVSAQLLGNLGRRATPGRELSLDKLSDREFEVFRMLGEGHNTRTIAERLKLSPKTVDAHKANIKTKLAMQDGAQLMRQAVRWAESQSTSQGTAGLR